MTQPRAKRVEHLEDVPLAVLPSMRRPPRPRGRADGGASADLAVVECPACGASAAADANFCAKCGNRLRS